MNRMKESAHLFGSSAALVGVLTEPAADTDRNAPAVVMLNSGLIHRVAPQRLYVRLARRLAQRGFTSLRFDFSGIGDSSVRTDGLPTEDSGVAETREAMDLLERLTPHRRFVLLGLCGGGYFSFRTALEDERACGLVLLNVRGHLHGGDAELNGLLNERAMSRHYRRIATAATYRRKNIRKILTGAFDVRGAVASLFSRRKAPDDDAGPIEASRDLPSLLERGIRVLNIYSEGDWSLDYVVEVLGDEFADRLSRPGSTFELVRGTNHVFTPRWSQDRIIDSIEAWLCEGWAADQRATDGTVDRLTGDAPQPRSGA